MAQLKSSVVEAFQKLGLEPSASQADATKAYKKLALLNHPDRNRGDPTATERFQEIGEAWSTCSDHYERPYMSYEMEPGDGRRHRNFKSGAKTFHEDDEVPLDKDEAGAFFRWMFENVFKNTYSRSKGRQYRSQRAGAFGDGVHRYSGANAAMQAREQKAYRQRVEEFEREIAAEQAELDRIAREEALARSRFAAAHDHAFQLASDGRSAELRKLVEEYALDVNKPRSQKEDNSTKMMSKFPTMLHRAAQSGDTATVVYLLEKGSKADAVDAAFLTPFHTAILQGNISVTRHFLSLYRTTKSTDPKYQSYRDGCHPNKAAKDKAGTTPLQLAIRSGNLEMVELFLKEATVHDAERCWKMIDNDQRQGPMGRTLRTKNGFVPPTEEIQMSKKALRKMKQAQEEARLNEEKLKQLAEEEENRLKNLARKEKAAKEKEAREAETIRVRKEAEEAQRFQAEREAAARHEAEMVAWRAAEEQHRLEAERTEKLRQQEAEWQAKLKQEQAERAAKQRQEQFEQIAEQKRQEAEHQAKIKQQQALAKQQADVERAQALAAAKAAESARQAALQQAEAKRLKARDQQAQKQAELLEWDRRRRAAANDLQVEIKRQAEAAALEQQAARQAEARRVSEEAEKVQQLQAKRDAAARQMVEMAARRVAEEQRELEAEQEATLKEHAEQLARLKQSQAEGMAKLRQREALAKQKAVAELAMAAAAAEAAESAWRQAEVERLRARDYQAQKQAELLEWDRRRRVRSNDRQAEASKHQREQEEAVMRSQGAEAHHQQDVINISQQDPVQDAAEIHQEIMRKRAEQSARDKARNQQLKEERAQGKVYTPSTSRHCFQRYFAEGSRICGTNITQHAHRNTPTKSETFKNQTREV
ncbi:hypothetical protein HWV62_1496 [Athelia sp. TMB]|nr:hypothetical protein HWV62_1496 [Athelia sp. TMB]